MIKNSKFIHFKNHVLINNINTCNILIKNKELRKNK